MEVITIESTAYNSIMKRMDRIEENMERLVNPVNQFQNKWVDSHDVLQMLKISRRTLTSHISSGKLRCSKINNKNYFKVSDVEEFLEEMAVRVGV